MPSNRPPARCHQIEFSGSILERGFWLYIWKIVPPRRRKPLYYVGRTGDNALPFAQSPFNRLGQHLGHNENNNALRRQLTARGMKPEQCRFQLVAVGPILAEAPDSNMELHKVSRDRIAAMECALSNRVRAAGCEVLNEVKCRKPLDRAAFEREFKKFVDALPELAG